MDPSSTSTSAAPLPDGVAREKAPTPLGLIGLNAAELAREERRPLQVTAPRRALWQRYVKFALLAAVPVGVAYAAHLASEPEGLEPEMRASGARVLETAVPTPVKPIATSAVPRRVFDDGAFGYSGAVRIRVALPGEVVALPMRLVGPTDGLTARWVGFDGKGNDATMTWPADGSIPAPSVSGAYWLVLSRAGSTDTVADFAMFVEKPMPNKRATGINGYHMGRWPKTAGAEIPRGFIEVTDRIADFPLSPHLRMSDFVVHDNQDGFPKYLHVKEKLLDKLELTIAEIAQMRGRAVSALTLNVVSGFRSPAHNGSLSASAKDSRHMYGDAADIGIDANNDGQLTEIDARLVAAAAEVVERKYPALVGGIGIYINQDGGGWPYVHIDTRGVRARWRGGPKRDVQVDSFSTADAAPPAPAPTAAPATGAVKPVPPVTAAPIATPDSAAAMRRSTAPNGGPAAPPASVAPAPAPTTPVRPVMDTRPLVVPPAPAGASAAGAARRPVATASARPNARPAAKPTAHPARRAAKKVAARPRPAAAASERRAPTPAAVSDDPFASAARRFRQPKP